MEAIVHREMSCSISLPGYESEKVKSTQTRVLKRLSQLTTPHQSARTEDSCPAAQIGANISLGKIDNSKVNIPSVFGTK